MSLRLLTPLDYLKIVFRRKWFLIIPLVLGIIGGIIAGNLLPKAYEASTLILVEEGRVINPLIHGLAISTSTAQRIGMLREQILGWDRMVQLISTLGLAREVKTQLQFEELVKKLRKDIKVKLRGQNIINISYNDRNAQDAQNIVKTITDIFIAENLSQQNKETEDAVAFINDQVALYQKKLKQSEIAAMEDQLDKLLVDSTDKHPLVINLKKKIASEKNELDQGDYAVEASSIAGSDKELKNLKEELKSMKEEVLAAGSVSAQGGTNRTRVATASNEKLYKLLLLDKISQVEARDEDVNKKLYNELLSRLETAKITQRLESSKEGTKYTILDPARLPLKPAKPNRPLILLLGAFIGLCLGAGLVCLVELFDHSFLGVEETKAFLELPMLGAVSKIVTQSDLRAKRLHNVKIASISIVTTIILVIVIIYNTLLGG